MADEPRAVAACDACGRMLHGSQLPEGRSLGGALGSHLERDCGPLAARQFAGLDG